MQYEKEHVTTVTQGERNVELEATIEKVPHLR
jgi:hypothetical protein